MIPEWRTSSRSGGVNDQACVEVAWLPGVSRNHDPKNLCPGHRALARTEAAVSAPRERGDRNH